MTTPVTVAPPVPTGQQNSGPPQESEPPSRLGPLVLSTAALALGGLGMADLAGAAVAPSAYLAVPLAVTGLGLLMGARQGRARWLIVPVCCSASLSLSRA